MRKHLENLFLGIIAAFGALIVTVFIAVLFQIFSHKNDFQAIIQYPVLIILAVLVEESFKYVVIRKRIAKQKTLSAPIVFGFGFALTEIAFLSSSIRILENYPFHGLLGALAIHILTAIVLTYTAKKESQKRYFPFLFGALLAISIHMAYNFAVIYEFSRQVSFLTITTLIIILISSSVTNKNTI